MKHRARRGASPWILMIHTSLRTSLFRRHRIFRVHHISDHVCVNLHLNQTTICVMHLSHLVTIRLTAVCCKWFITVKWSYVLRLCWTDSPPAQYFSTINVISLHFLYCLTLVCYELRRDQTPPGTSHHNCFRAKWMAFFTAISRDHVLLCLLLQALKKHYKLDYILNLKICYKTTLFWVYHKPLFKFWSNSIWQWRVRVVTFVVLVFSYTGRL
jgi:hypothetical protein